MLCRRSHVFLSTSPPWSRRWSRSYWLHPTGRLCTWSKLYLNVSLDWLNIQHSLIGLVHRSLGECGYISYRARSVHSRIQIRCGIFCLGVCSSIYDRRTTASTPRLSREFQPDAVLLSFRLIHMLLQLIAVIGSIGIERNTNARVFFEYFISVWSLQSTGEVRSLLIRGNKIRGPFLLSELRNGICFVEQYYGAQCIIGVNGHDCTRPD